MFCGRLSALDQALYIHNYKTKTAQISALKLVSMNLVDCGIFQVSRATL